MAILSSKKILIPLIAIIVAVAVWFGLSSSGAGDSNDLLTSDITAEGGADRELVASLLALRAVRLEGLILTNPAFNTLQDFSTAIVAEPVGRPNPFAPLGSRSSGTTTSSGPVFQGR